MSGPGNQPLADQTARDAAVHTFDRPVWVEAGAGTGKTTLLIGRLLHAIESGRARAADIVAITFTEKAAAELRLRLRQELERRLRSSGSEAAPALENQAAPPTQAPGRVRRALVEMQQARISTIHAFASSLLREHPVEVRIDPRFRTLDELESLQVQNTFWSTWMETELGDDEGAELLRRLVSAGVRLEPDMRDLVRALYANRDVAAGIRRPPAPRDLEARFGAWRDAALLCVRHAETNCRDPHDKGLQHLLALRAALLELDDLEPSSWPGIFLSEMDIQPRLGRRDAWQPGAAQASKEMRERLRVSLREIQQDITNGVLRTALAWAERYIDAYQKEKRRLGVLDFQDLLLKARALVAENLTVRRELGRSIGMLCVDEFQDTDPLQAEIVMFLSEVDGRATRWTDVRVGPRLFLVGDPKQSIYRFRRADLDVYARCRELVRESGGLLLDVVQNFRSRATVLHWVNGVFETLFAAEPTDPSAPGHVPLLPARQEAAEPTPAALWIVRGQAANETSADAARRAEADAIARLIHVALGQAWPVREADAVRPLGAADIAILFGRTAGIEVYEEALRRARLPFRQEGGKLFFQRQEVRDVLHALAACDDPGDELSIVAALRSSLFGVTDEELWLHRAKASFDYMAVDQSSPLAEPFRILASLHAGRQTRGVAATIEELLAATQYEAVCAARPHGDRVWTNLETLIRQARDYEAARPVGLREFVRSFRELDEDPPKLAEWAPEQEGTNHIRLLTVHMAKGLEFPFVFLANLSTRANTQNPPVLFDRLAAVTEFRLRASEADRTLPTPGYDTAAERERVRDQAEERRLLYVAATRARDYLAVGAFAAARPEGYLELLQRATGALGETGCGQLSAPATDGAWLRGGDTALWRLVDAAALPAWPRIESVGRLPDVEERRRARLDWQQSHCERLRSASAAGGWAAVDAAAGTRVSPDTQRVGVLTHRILAAVLAPAPHPTGDDVLRDLPERFACADVAGDIERLVKTALASPLEARARAAQRIWRNVQWVARVGTQLFDDVLDLVFEEDGALVVVDYTLRHLQESDREAERHVQRLRRLALGASGHLVREAGTFFLQSGDYVSSGDAVPPQGWR